MLKELVAKRFIFPVFILICICSCSGYKKQVKIRDHEESAIVLSGKYKPYSVNGITYYPLPASKGFVQEGMASWYGKEFHGRRAANGEIFNMYKKTAAHKILPFGTYVRVENLSNRKKVVVRINDRGPFIKGRIVDLAYSAAEEIGLVGPGVAKVRLVALSEEVGKIGSGDNSRPLIKPKDFKKGQFTIQVGAFENEDNAKRLADRLKVIFDPVSITKYLSNKGKTLYRVRVSLFDNLTKADQVVKKLEYLGFSKTFIVAL